MWTWATSISCRTFSSAHNSRRQVVDPTYFVFTAGQFAEGR
jgi:hypothetical protein